MHNHDDLLQMQGRLCNMVNKIEDMQWELARLLQETRTSHTKIDALIQHVVQAKSQQRIHENLADFLSQFEANQEKLEGLEKTVKKLTRTQFKSNTLGENKEQQVSESLSLLRDLATRREKVNEAQQREEQERIAALQVQARGELAADLLPVLDGIEMALENGTAILSINERQQGPEEAPSFFRKLFGRSPAPAEHEPPDMEGRQNSKEALSGWLHGLDIVRERFLRLLALEGIEAIPAQGEVFDPHLHVALETDSRNDVPENTVVDVIRKGYMQHDRVLRYAEVIVAKAPPPAPMEKSTDSPDKDESATTHI